VWHGGKAIHPPSWGFLFHHRQCAQDWGKERARRRRVAPVKEGAEDRTGGKDHLTTGTPSTRQGDTAPRRKGEKREPAGDQEQEPRRTTTGVNLYLAFVHLSTEPATTPPPPRSEQHRGHLISFLPP
jgi:hypothetical protein